jgi:hypothetical protein
MRYDYNRTGTLNLPELHDFLNELFMMTGHPHRVSYMEAYQALMSMDANRDGHINKFEMFNLFRHMTQPGFRPLPYNYGNYSYGGVGVGAGYGGGFGGINGGCYGGVNGGIVSSPITYTNTVTSSPMGLGVAPLRGMGCDPSWNSNWSSWA